MAKIITSDAQILKIGSIESPQRLIQRRPIIQHNPLNNRQWQTAVLDQVIMKLAQPEIFALFIFVAAEQIHDLPFACDVADFLRRT